MADCVGTQGVSPNNLKQTGFSIIVSAPGKIILHGEHSVVYGRLAIAASLGLRTRVTIAEIDAPDSLILQFSNLNLNKTYSLKAFKEHLLNSHLPLTNPPSEFNWELPDIVHHESLLDKIDNFLNTNESTDLSACQAAAVKCIFFLLVGILSSVDIELDSVVIDVSTQLDVGAGTGSSASYVVSLSAALLQYVKSKRECGNFAKPGFKPSSWHVDLTTFSKKELEMICSWAYCAEKIVHLTPSGLDNTICTYGSMVEFRKGLSPKLLDITCPFKVLLINTKVPRETKRLVSQVAKMHDKYPDLVNNILNAMEDVAFIALQNIVALSEIEAIGDTTLQHRNEIDKIFENLGQLSSMNHNLLSALGVSHSKLDEVVHLLAEYGLHGKLTGAGGGGYAIALVPPRFDHRALDEVIKLLERKGFGVACTVLGGEGVKVESV
uniref:Mevalonate kinase n=1 Tax=Colaphellus bowringi TaxID=561076 RepID=A0A8G0QFG0_9CUCU|nr:mevalonate kinase [Colaphellus bowringi]